MLISYLIGLREGLEAGIIVSILVAYLGKVGRRDLLPKLWIGIAAAIAISLGVGAIMTFGPSTLSTQAQEILGGAFSLLAVGMVTWMILWMANHARSLRSELQGRMDVALGGSGVALVALGIVSVGREGIETAVFVWAAATSSADPLLSFVLVILGILSAVVLSVLISLGVLRIDYGRFFTWTGALLVLVAAGVLAYGIGDLQEGGVIPGVGQAAYSLAGLIPPTSWGGVLLTGIFNFTPEPTWPQVIAWTLYLVVVGTLFLRRQLRRSPSPAPQTSDHVQTGAA